jgi:hypothetical protein
MAPDEIEVDVSVLRMEYGFAIAELTKAQATAQEARTKVEAALYRQFAARIREMIDRNGSFSLQEVILSGVPCSDCLGVATTKTRPVHTFSLSSPDDGTTWGADARCGQRMEPDAILVQGG